MKYQGAMLIVASIAGYFGYLPILDPWGLMLGFGIGMVFNGWFFGD